MHQDRVIRVFRAVAKSGREDAFADFFATEAVALVRKQDGLVTVQVGLPADDADEFVMITTWRDIDALRAFAGPQWREPVIDPREAPLLERVYVHHYFGADTSP